MTIVDKENNYKQHFINSLTVHDIENKLDKEGDNNAETQEEKVNNNSNSNLNAYSTQPLPANVSIQSLPLPTIYAQSTTIPTVTSSQSTADSGATHHMITMKSIHLCGQKWAKPFALMVDGTTTCSIKGYCYANYCLNGHPIRKLQLYVPELKNSPSWDNVDQLQSLCIK